ncbi:hypothetical protein M422DRAFT_226922 [Sphaerobolus stellatus SS14]|uniref:Cytochrome P450 n=1 Tax=Sphaerobolus stellatus (strain SS14) TaxID=990650 RepID=A0A0C9W2K7_SPHS4|nr:hypothetical protein M422DRAFT_226922 [Sphaerobolus stellatus SS14]
MVFSASMLSSWYKAVLASSFVFTVALLASIVAYRLSPFHPLSKYPGPYICKISKIWTAWIAVEGKLHLYHQDLHRRYGPIVRVGPNELSIVDADLVPAILGVNGMPKGPLWDGRRITPSKELTKANVNNLIGNRDSVRHAQLRKPWNRAFGPSPMQDYVESLVARGGQFAEALEIICKSSPKGIGHVDIAKYFSFLSFDFMGDMAFGGGFELLRDGDKNKWRENMENALILPSISQHIPWAAAAIRSIPLGTGSMRNFGAFAVAQAKRRSTQESTKKDLFYHLAVQTDDGSDKPPFPLIISNATLAIIAGSDTTASVLSNIVYYLVRYPEYLRRLQEDLDKRFPEYSAIDLDQLSHIELLTMIINEALRLQPPVPTSLQRAPAIGSGGKAVGNMFIPEGTAVVIPPYTLHRDPRYFSPQPEKFWPERWAEKEQGIINNRSAFIPFSYGPANCAGKPLAMLELRFLMTTLVRKFDMSFDEGYDPDQWERDLKDRFVLSKGELPIKLSLRHDQ